MKIVSYNINGVRASSKNGLKEFIKNCNADCYAFQETRADGQIVEELLNTPGYNLFHKEGNKKGYAGVAVLTKNRLNAKQVEFGNISDTEGRILAVEIGDILLVDFYTPNGNSRLDFKLDYMTQFLQILKTKLNSGKQIVVCTDFNISHSPLDLSNPDQCKNISGYLPQERQLFDNYLDAGLVDSFRKLHPLDNRYTWSSYGSKKLNNSIGNLWTFDYVFVSNSLESNLFGAGVLLDVNCSDHYPVFATMEE